MAGVDEAGRGALAGPVVAAAVILPPGLHLEGLNDSKLLHPRRRESLCSTIQEQAVAVGLGVVDVWTIDAGGILQATLLAMTKAVAALLQPPEFLLIDGTIPPPTSLPHWTLPHGDRLYPSIAAASIVAKVTRDRIMDGYDQDLPQYGFRRNKGYGTLEHLQALARYGPSEVHRRSFHPVGERRK